MDFLRKLWQCIFCWKVESSSEDELASAKVMIVQSFAFCQGDSDRSNKALAKIARDIHEKHGTHMILQGEVADFLHDLPKIAVIRKHRIAGRRMDTLNFLSQAKERCENFRWKKAIIIAHPDRYWRCVMAARKMGLEGAVTVDVSAVQYDNGAKQWWARSRKRFIPREILARLIYCVDEKI